MQDISLEGDGHAANNPYAAPAIFGATGTHAASAPESHPFSFTGTAGSFFAIWIVNLFLTIITLGIYSAWAKVRKKRYFYGHTWVGGANFEYHGNPIAILKGRLIAVAVFAVYSGVGHFMPKVAAMLALVLFVAAPWFIVRSMAFNAYNSSYRNIRFRFQATYMDVLKAIWPIALVLIFSLVMPEIDRTNKVAPPTLFWVLFGLQMLAIFSVYPFAIGKLKILHVNHSQYGAAPFKTDLGVGPFYKIYFLAMLLAFGAVIVIGIVAGVVVAGAAAAGAGRNAGVGMSIAAGLFFMIVYFGMGSLMLGYTKSRISNLVFNNTRLDGEVSFTSTLKLRRLAVIYLTNMFAILFSLGLAIPWAVVRMMRYRAECLTLESSTSLDAFVGGVSAQVGATGEELGEFFSVDLSL